MGLSGGCHCGAVRYTALGEVGTRSLCHCADCQGTTGAPAVAWFSCPADQLDIVGALTTYASSAGAERQFCTRCGTQLIWRERGGDMLDVTTASLDDPAARAAVRQVFTHSRLAFMAHLADLPEHEGAGGPA